MVFCLASFVLNVMFNIFLIQKFQKNIFLNNIIHKNEVLTTDRKKSKPNKRKRVCVCVCVGVREGGRCIETDRKVTRMRLILAKT